MSDNKGSINIQNSGDDDRLIINIGRSNINLSSSLFTTLVGVANVYNLASISDISLTSTSGDELILALTGKLEDYFISTWNTANTSTSGFNRYI